ncbi:MAG TPA: P-loop NTPase fold protein [Allosphingosinicella sp.]|nr:P-loop NTPase fold protein [Allosphingosinicella sp.]
MGAPRKYEPSWGEIAAQVARQLGLTTDRSPTLRQAIERGVRYINVRKGELVFDTRAMFLGLLAAGTEDRDSIRYGNTASWFRGWLTEQLGEDKVLGILAGQAMSPPEQVFPAVQNGHKVILSVSVKELRKLAAQIAKKTVGRSLFEARHMMGAMIVKGTIVDQVQEIFLRSLDSGEVEALKRFFVERIMGSPEEGEDREKWFDALLLSGPGKPEKGGDSEGARPAAPWRDAVVPFSRDTITIGSDVLQTAGDARALARLICLRDSTPLAVAIFGGWGSGKSTFMERLDAEVTAIVDEEAECVRTFAEADLAQRPFISRVVQMRFNAWQFVDSNLWASLAAEFFDQLRAGGWNRTSKVRHAGLVERVNRHVHSLSADAEARRQAAIEGGKDVLKAQQERDAAAQAAREAEGATLGQAAIDALRDLYEARKPELTALGMRAAGVDTGAAVDAVVDIVRSSNSILGRAGQIGSLLAKSRTRTAVTLVSLAAFAIAGCLLALYLTESPEVGRRTLVALITALGALGAAATAAAPAFRLVNSIAKRGADIAQAVRTADDKAVKTLLRTEVELRDVTAEAEALAGAAERADRALSRYVDPNAASNPPRLLRFVLEDDPDTKALASEIGLIGRTRRLFQAVDDIVREERGKPLKERLDGEVPDRIVLYIDDLDRCTEEQVYAVLQAIHLLLAFDLFAVVVGVDVAWVENALAKMFEEKESGGASVIDRRQRAVRYLEKIFQVAFWLAPLNASGGDGGSFGRYVRQLAARPAPPPATPSPPQAEATPGETDETDLSRQGGEAGDPASAAGESGDETEFDGGTVGDTRAAIETITLEQDEIDFLASPEIAAIAAATPRSVKRLVNVYRLVRTRLAEEGASIMGGDGQPPDYPLIAFAVAIETGQPIDVADAFFEGLKSLGPAENFSRLLYENYFGVEDDADVDGLPPLTRALVRSPGLNDALERILTLRLNDLLAADALRVAKVARRYSFNRYE